MGTALADYDPDDGCATGWTRLAGALVGPEMVLELAAAIYPINAGSIAAETLSQRGADAPP
jgi:hypothetical protein